MRGIGRAGQIDLEPTTSVVETTTTTYELRSEVLGNQVVTEIKPDGTKKAANVYANGQRIAEYKNLACTSACPQSTNIVETNPLTGSGFRAYGGSGGTVRDERDPQGANTGTEDPWLTLAEPMFKDLYASQEPFIEGGGNALDPRGGCVKDGAPYDCTRLAHELDHGTAVGAIFRNGNYLGQIEFGSASGSGKFRLFIAASINTHTDVRMLEEGDKPSDVPDSSGGAPVGTYLDVNFHWNFNWTAQRNLPGHAPPPQDNETATTRKFPCPLSWTRGILAPKFGGTQVSETLIAAKEDSIRNRREEGGWIYMNRRRMVKAVRKDLSSGARQTAIDLSSPPELPGWIVIADFHSHDFGTKPSETVPNFVTGDRDINTYQSKIPGLIMGQHENDPKRETVWTPYGPERGFFGVGLPDRCR